MEAYARDLEAKVGMLRSVHGALVDAGLRVGVVGHCEADLVRTLIRDRNGALEEIKRLRADIVWEERNRTIERDEARAKLAKLREALAKVQRFVQQIEAHRIVKLTEAAGVIRETPPGLCECHVHGRDALKVIDAALAEVDRVD